MRIKNFEHYQTVYKHSVEHPEGFWDGVAKQFTWRKPWTKTLEWNFEEPNVKWFIDGKFNITENCIDRHLPEKAGDIAFYFEANDINGKSRTVSYKQLYDEVCRLANTLKSFG